MKSVKLRDVIEALLELPEEYLDYEVWYLGDDRCNPDAGFLI